MDDFAGIWVPLVTAFRNGSVDLKATQKLATHLFQSGITGLVVCGTTGEPAALGDDEKAKLLSAVIEAAPRRCRVIMGLCGNNTQAVVQSAKRFRDFDIAGFLVSAPYYVRPSQEGIRRHFEAIADVSERPIVLYNIPYRTGVNIDLATIKTLAADSRFVAIKQSGGGDIDQLTDLIYETPLTVLCGEDALIFAAACLGAHGAVAAAAHIRPDLYVRMLQHIRAGELEHARSIWANLLPLIRLLFSEPNPGPIKSALALEGWLAEELRLPMTPVSAGCRAWLEKMLADLPTA